MRKYINFYYDIKKLECELNPIYQKLMREVQLSANADKHYSGKVDITELLKPFRHIMIDEKYKLIAYSSYEYHGPFGKAVAVESDKPTPDVYLEIPNFLFQRIIPEVCYPVKEVLFCDGTPEGFFEAILFDDMLWKLFKGYHEAYLDNYIFSYKEIKKEKGFILKLADWIPKFYKSMEGIREDKQVSNLLLMKKFPDKSIALQKYSFSNCFPKRWQTAKEYSHIDFEMNRFSESKHCCFYSCKAFCIRDEE